MIAEPIQRASQLESWWVYVSENGSLPERQRHHKEQSIYRDDALAAASRFAGTLVRKAPRPGFVIHYPYEFYRHRAVEYVVRTLRKRMMSACFPRWDKSEFPTSPSTIAIRCLGCSPSRLIEVLEEKMTEGMSWSNCGQWHIDHIIPLAKCDLRRPCDAAACCHHSNLQPLWASDNCRKGDQMPLRSETEGRPRATKPKRAARRKR
jgi:hypothetical protein